MSITEWHLAGQTATAFYVIALAVTFIWQWRRDPR